MAHAVRQADGTLLSREHGKGLLWTDRIQSLVIKRLLDGLNEAAEAAYKEGQSLNTLVVIDEAHRLAPRELSRDEDETVRSVRRVLVDASRTPANMGWAGSLSANPCRAWTATSSTNSASSSSASA